MLRYRKIITIIYLIISFQAKRSGVTKVILPEENRRDFLELPEFIKTGISVHFVSNYSDVYNIAFAN